MAVNEPKEERRLSVIFAADVAGYSRLMATNEKRTLALLEASRKFIDKKISEYNGKIANTAGDSVIATFASATEALNCSIIIQEKLVKQNEKFTENKRLLFRIGLHMGEIFTKGTDILGSGVNIAARLEGQAETGAVCMSETFLSIVDRSAIESRPIADLGYLSLKNIEAPIKAFEVLSGKAQRSGVEVRHQASIAKQKKIIAIVGGGVAVVLVSVGLAIAVTFNLWKVGQMATKNSINSNNNKTIGVVEDYRPKPRIPNLPPSPTKN
jgi:class 3 adenylate cyclase